MPSTTSSGVSNVVKSIDMMGLLVVVGLLLSAVFALVFNSPRLLLLQGSAVNGLFGIVMSVAQWLFI
jgi:intracellular septation protein A